MLFQLSFSQRPTVLISMYIMYICTSFKSCFSSMACFMLTPQHTVQHHGFVDLSLEPTQNTKAILLGILPSWPVTLPWLSITSSSFIPITLGALPYLYLGSTLASKCSNPVATIIADTFLFSLPSAVFNVIVKLPASPKHSATVEFLFTSIKSDFSQNSIIGPSTCSVGVKSGAREWYFHLTGAPPSSPLFSTSRTCMPNSARSIAALSPAGPDPMTRTLSLFSLLNLFHPAKLTFTLGCNFLGADLMNEGFIPFFIASIYSLYSLSAFCQSIPILLSKGFQSARCHCSWQTLKGWAPIASAAN